MNDKKNFEELCRNKEFLQKVLSQKNEDDVKKLFMEEGIKISQQELNEIKEIISLILGKKQPLSIDEIKGVSGGIRTEAIIQLSSAIIEAMTFLLRTQVEMSDPTGSIGAIRVIDEKQDDPSNISLGRIASNAVNGTLDLDPRLRSAANRVVAWWNGK